MDALTSVWIAVLLMCDGGGHCQFGRTVATTSSAAGCEKLAASMNKIPNFNKGRPSVTCFKVDDPVKIPASEQ